MFNLIRLEFYKLRRQWLFKLLLLAVIAISAFSAFSEMQIMAGAGILGSGKIGFANAFKDMFMLFISGIFAAFYIGSDFSNKTISAQLAQGHSRLSVILAKTLVFFMGTSLIMLLYPLTVAIIHTFAYGWGEPFTVVSLLYILRVAALGAMLNMGTTSFFVLFAFWCRDIPKTICACFAFPILISAISATLGKAIPLIQRILGFTTLAQLSHITKEMILPSTVVTALLSAAITVIIAISFSYLLFAKAEIK